MSCDICGGGGRIFLPVLPNGYDGRIPIEHVAHEKRMFWCPGCTESIGRRDVAAWREKLEMEMRYKQLNPAMIYDPAVMETRFDPRVEEEFLRGTRGMPPHEREKARREYEKFLNRCNRPIKDGWPA